MYLSLYFAETDIEFLPERILNAISYLGRSV